VPRTIAIASASVVLLNIFNLPGPWDIMLSLSAMNAYRWCLFPADNGRRIAANVAKLPGLMHRIKNRGPSTLLGALEWLHYRLVTILQLKISE